MLKLAAIQVIPSKILLLPMANLTRLQKNQNCSSAAEGQINQSTAHNLQYAFLTLYNGLAIRKNCSFIAVYIT